MTIEDFYHQFNQFKWRWHMLLAVGCFFLLILLIDQYDVVQKWREGSQLLAANPQGSISLSQDIINIQSQIESIPNNHLFGEYKVIRDTKHLPESANFTLTGIMKGSSKSKSAAIIAEDDKGGKVYRVGDTLPGGARVYSIRPQSVVIDNGGQLEKLSLPRQNLVFKPMDSSLF